MLPLLVVLLALLLIPAQAADIPQYAPLPCDGRVPEPLIQRADVVCGEVTAALDPQNPDAGTHQLFVVRIRTVEAPLPDPILFLSGGPGISIDAYWTFITALLDAGLTDSASRDLVVYDQRGIGQSTPALDCFREEAAASRIRTDINRLCAARLGVAADLSVYHTVNNAADVEALRRAMGFEALNLYGHSYGTRLALAVMRHQPQAVRSVLLEGVFPPDVRFLALPATVSRVMTRVFDACAEDAACANAYGDLDALFSETYVYLRDGDGGAYLDAQVFVNIVYYLIETSRADQPSLIAQFIHGVRHQNSALVVPAIQQALTAIPPEETIYEGAMSLVNCADEAPVFSEAYFARANAEARPEIMAVIGASIRRQFIENCRNWPYADLGTGHQDAVTSDAPSLIFNGTFDEITPVEYAYRAAETLTYVTVVPFAGWGHWILGHGNACATTIYADFLNTPETPPDTSCAAAQTIPFALP